MSQTQAAATAVPQAPPANDIILNGKAVGFRAGESVIQAAIRHDVEIPHYCWHPRLSVAANCRMCLVEVEKAPKLVPACQTECRPGMVVHTHNAKVQAAQKSVHELLLINHPIDCPICDQAGECKLQDYYMKYQLSPSRMREPKVHKPTLKRLGPYVTYNAQRCVMCTRCVRFMEEVPKQRQLAVVGRGDHSEISTVADQPLDSPYSLNTVDVCPVGALTSTAFRFKQRVWNLRRTPSICPGCATGCNVHVDQRAGQVYRMLPRENEQVNKSWMCDAGRLTYNRANDARTSVARLRQHGELQDTATHEVVDVIAQKLNAIKAQPFAIKVAMSMHATCEDALAVALFVKTVLQHDEVAVLGYDDGEADALLRNADCNPNRLGIQRIFDHHNIRTIDGPTLIKSLGDTTQVLLTIGHEFTLGEALARAAAHVGFVVDISFAEGPVGQMAHASLPSTSWVEAQGTWLSGGHRLQKLTPAFEPAHEAQALLCWLVALQDKIRSTSDGSSQITPVLPRTPAEAMTQLGAQGGAFAGIDIACIPALGQKLSDSDTGGR